MSPRLSTESSGGGKSAIAIVVVGVLAVVVFVLLRLTPEVRPFDPKSGDRSGTRALIELLEANGAEVTVTAEVPTSLEPGLRLFVIEDRLNDRQRAEVESFARAGGVVVVADPNSALNGTNNSQRRTSSRSVNVSDEYSSFAEQSNLPLGRCTVGALAHLRGLAVDDDTEFVLPDGEDRCFGEDRSFVVVRAVGNGIIVGLGDNWLFTNGRIRLADNGPLATALLAPTDGSRVVYLRGTAPPAVAASEPESTERTLSDLVRPGVWMALAQLATAFVVLALGRAVRPGRPVREPRPVPLAANEAVLARGNLMRRAGHAQRAGWLLRADAARRLAATAHLPPSATVSDIDAAVAQRFHLAPGHVSAVLLRDVVTDEQLVRLRTDLGELRAAVEAVPSPSVPADVADLTVLHPEGALS